MENGKVSLTPQKWRHPLAFNRVYRSQPAAYIMLLRLFRRRRRHFQSWLMRGASPCPRWAAHHTSALLRPCKLINRAETAANWRCWPIKALGWPIIRCSPPPGSASLNKERQGRPGVRTGAERDLAPAGRQNRLKKRCREDRTQNRWKKG